MTSRRAAMRRNILLLLLLLCAAQPGVTPAQNAAKSKKGDTVKAADQDYRLDTELPPGFDEIEYERLRARLSPVDQALREQAGAQSKEKKELPEEQGITLGGNSILVRSKRTLIYERDTNFIYGRDRSLIRAGKFTLEADRIVIDVRLLEVQADGNVEIHSEVGDIKAASVFFNFATNQGVAWGVKGNTGALRFRADPDAPQDLPSFEQLSKNQVLFERSRFTTDDFPRPMYEIKAQEVMLFPKERVYMRNAIVYVREVPVLYLPAYTRSLNEKGAWHFVFGHDDDLGVFALGTYSFEYYNLEPDLENDGELIERSRGTNRLKFDYFSERGFGYGLGLNYTLNYDQHKGLWDVYGINDEDYHVVDSNEQYRYQSWIRHRSQLTENLWFHLNLDWMSDPEFYFDIMDERASGFDEERGRLPERQFRTALSYVRDNWLIRGLYEDKERITRDRVTNFTEPSDDDDDYATDEDLLRDETDRLAGVPVDDDRDFDNDEGVNPKRYATVTRRQPELTFATSWLNIFRSPLYYDFDVNVINNLDKGLNTGSSVDDSMVRGIDLYGQLLFYHQFTHNTNLVYKVGVGGGSLNREDDSFELEFPETATGEELTFPSTPFNNGLIFVDEDTFLVGDEEKSLDDVSNSFAYADSDLQLNHRFSRALSGYLRHFLREGTDDGLGEFYESIGSRLTRNDLYDFRLRQHFAEAGLNYRLAQPNFRANLTARRNLESSSDNVPNEQLTDIRFDWSIASSREDYKLHNSWNYETFQIRNPGDEFAYEREILSGDVSLDFNPLHKNYWGSIGFSWFETLNQDPARNELDDDEIDDDNDDDDDDDRFDETETQTDVFLRLVTRIGPKWAAQFDVFYDIQDADLDSASIVLSRDLHDAVLNFELSVDDDIFDDENDEDLIDNISFKVSVSFKLPDQDMLEAQPVQSAFQSDRKLEES